MKDKFRIINDAKLSFLTNFMWICEGCSDAELQEVERDLNEISRKMKQILTFKEIENETSS